MNFAEDLIPKKEVGTRDVVYKVPKDLKTTNLLLSGKISHYFHDICDQPQVADVVVSGVGD